MPAKRAKPTNDDFCPQCSATFPRDQRDFHIMGHNQKMNQEVLRALDGIRQELGKLNPGSLRSA